MTIADPEAGQPIAAEVVAAALTDSRPTAERRSATELMRSLEVLHGVEMAVTVELGRTRLSVRELLNLAQGSIVELDRPAGAAVDVLVNGTLIARGEVVVVDDEFGVRVSEVIGRDDERRAP